MKANERRYDLAPICECCGTSKDLRSNSIMRKGHSTVICKDCFGEWYDGMLDPKEIKQTVLAKRASGTVTSYSDHPGNQH